MQVDPISIDGTRRVFRVTIPRKDLRSAFNERLAQARIAAETDQGRKFTTATFRSMAGNDVMQSLIRDLQAKAPVEIMKSRGERAAVAPEISMTAKNRQARDILACRADLVFDVSFDVVPPFSVMDLTSIAIDRPVAKATTRDIDREVRQMVDAFQTNAKRKRSAMLDQATLNSMGFADMPALRSRAKRNIEASIGLSVRLYMKRQIFDALLAGHAVEAPEPLARREFNTIWTNYQAALRAGRATSELIAIGEEQAKSMIREKASRRVRLGVIVAEIGERAGLKVSDDEAFALLLASQKGGVSAAQRKELADYCARYPDELDQYRSALFEERVVDAILSVAQIADRKVTRTELERIAA